MYVIFPLDELLDLHSARENKRGRTTLDQPSHTRHTEEVLPHSQPNQLLPNQLKPPLNKQPKTNLQQPTPPPKQQKAPPTPTQKQPSQKPSLSKASSKTSLAVTPPIAVPPQSPVSVTSSIQAANVKKQSTTQQQQQQQQQQQTITTAQVLLPDQVTKRQRSSTSTSTETSSTSSTGAKGKSLLSPQASGGLAANRSSWSGSTTVVIQESCPSRQGSYTAFKDLSVSTDGNGLKVVEQKRSESTQDIPSSSQKPRPPLNKSASFRSHLSDTVASRLPKLTALEALKKAQAAATTLKLPLPSSETQKKTQKEIVEPSHHQPAQVPKTAETTTAAKPEISQQSPKEKQSVGVEGVKIKQEVPVQASPSPPPLSQHQISAAESLRIQQECLPPSSDPKALSTNQRHPSGKSNRSSGSQKLSDLPPSGVGGGSRGALAPGSANPKSPGALGSPRGQKNNTVMASNEASFRDLTNPSHNESLKAHNAFTFKLVKTGRSSGSPEGSQSSDDTSDHLHMAEAAGEPEGQHPTSTP